MKQFNLPDAGEGLTEAEIVTWKVKPGDTVKVNDIVVEIETAKSLVELPVAVRRHGHRAAGRRGRRPSRSARRSSRSTTGVDDRQRRRAGAGDRAPAAGDGRRADEEIEAGMIGGAAPGGRTAVLVGYGATDDRGQAPPPQGRGAAGPSAPPPPRPAPG